MLILFKSEIPINKDTNFEFTNHTFASDMKTTIKKNTKKEGEKKMIVNDKKPKVNGVSKVDDKLKVDGVSKVYDKKSKVKDGKTILISTYGQGHGFFGYLAKRYLLGQDVVELTGLGQAITKTVEVAEYLKTNGYITIQKIEISNVPLVEKDKTTGKEVTKNKSMIQIFIVASEKFYELMEGEIWDE